MRLLIVVDMQNDFIDGALDAMRMMQMDIIG